MKAFHFSITTLVTYLWMAGVSECSWGQSFPGAAAAPFELESLRIVPEPPGPDQTVYVTFQGLPWTTYTMFGASGLGEPTWAPVERAAEGAPGHYRFHHVHSDGRQFYRGQSVLPGPIKTFDALYEGAAAQLGENMAFYGLSFNAESLGAMEDLSLELHKTIEELSDALEGEIIVQPLAGFGQGWRVAWGGMEQMTFSPTERDQAVAGFEQARLGAAADRQNAEMADHDLSNLVFKTRAVESLAHQAMEASRQDAQTLRQLSAPTGNAYVCYDAGLAMIDVEALNLRKAGLAKQKSALQKTIQKLRGEAARKRRVADMPVQVFGINGVWHVRWSVIERTYDSEEEARTLGVRLVELLRAARLREAMELETRANELDQQLQQVCAEYENVCATIDFLSIGFENQLPGCDSNPIEDPEDEFDPRATFKSFLDFDAQYLDDMWIQMYREWQRAKDRLRAQLIRMGASAETIREMEKRWDAERECRPKWMTVFCDEPIKLKLLTFAAFVPFEFDVDNAKWEVEYKDFGRLVPVRVQVGTGGELCILPEQVKQIFAEAKRIQGDTGNVQLIEFVVTFDKVYANGTRESCNQIQQINVWDWTREKYDGIFGQFIR